MARRIRLEPHLSEAELEQRYRQAKEGTVRGWWQILWLLSRGQTAKEIAQSTGYSRYWIGQLAKRYNTEGVAGMRDRRHTDSRRAPLALSGEQMQELRLALQGPAPHGERWSGRVVAEWIGEKLGRPVRYQLGWDYLIRLGGRPRAPRPRHARADPATQLDFIHLEGMDG
jgi:transposase